MFTQKQRFHLIDAINARIEYYRAQILKTQACDVRDWAYQDRLEEDIANYKEHVEILKDLLKIVSVRK